MYNDHLQTTIEETLLELACETSPSDKETSTHMTSSGNDKCSDDSMSRHTIRALQKGTIPFSLVITFRIALH